MEAQRMRRSTYQEPFFSLNERIQAAEDAMRALKRAREQSAPVSERLRLLDEWREAVRRL